MEYDFIKIEEHNTLAECQIAALSDVNNHLIETESCLQRILKIKNIKVPNTTRTKLLSLLDYLNKIIITPNSSRNFSYQYFFYYREVRIKMNDISFHFDFPIMTSEVIPSLKSLFEKIIKFLNQPNHKKSSKKMNKNLQTNNSDFNESKANSLNDIFTKLISLGEKPFEFAKAQDKFHELPNIIKDTFTELKKDSSMFLIDYSIILESINECINDINLANQVVEDFIQTTTVISSIKNVEEVKCDEKNDEENHNENDVNNSEDPKANSDEIQKSNFQKRLPPKPEDQSDDDFEINIENPNLFSAQNQQHTPERRKSIHTNLVTIIEENDKKIQQLQQNLSNEVRKTEDAIEEITKLRHHYRKKIKKLKEQIIELSENNVQKTNQDEIEELKEKSAQLEKENLDLANTVKELKEENDFFAKEIEKNEQQMKEQDNSEEITQLNETIQIQEIEIQDLDKMNKKYKETMDKLIKENDDVHQENDELKSIHSQFEKKEQLLIKQISLLSTQNSRATRDIQKVLSNQEKRLNKFSEIISSQIITSPDEEINKQLNEFNQIKKIMSERKIYTIGDIDNLLKDYDRLKSELAKGPK